MVTTSGQLTEIKSIFLKKLKYLNFNYLLIIQIQIIQIMRKNFSYVKICQKYYVDTKLMKSTLTMAQQITHKHYRK